jgi:hypothetical protein
VYEVALALVLQPVGGPAFEPGEKLSVAWAHVDGHVEELVLAGELLAQRFVDRFIDDRLVIGRLVVRGLFSTAFESLADLGEALMFARAEQRVRGQLGTGQHRRANAA